MPANKDFKRLVRARMQKTGESYTAARRQLLDRTPSHVSPEPAVAMALPPAPADYARIAGMSDAAVMAYQKDAITGHRPTWKMGTGKHNVKPDLSGFGARGDPFGLFGEGLRNEQKKREETRPIRNAERKALDKLGLDVGATPHQVKMRFKELVKRHHPDANGGDRSTEDRLVEVIQAYNYLKSAGFG